MDASIQFLPTCLSKDSFRVLLHHFLICLLLRYAMTDDAFSIFGSHQLVAEISALCFKLNRSFSPSFLFSFDLNEGLKLSHLAVCLPNQQGVTDRLLLKYLLSPPH